MTSLPSTSELPTIIRDIPHDLPAKWEQVDHRVVSIVRQTIRNGMWPMVFSGNVGSGKTYAAALIYASWPENPVRWFSAVDFTRVIQTARREGQVLLPGATYPVGEASVWSVSVDQPSLIVFDDMGIRSPTASQAEIIHELIDRRGKKPLIITTNHTLDGLGRLFDDRIASRLSAGTLLLFHMEDRRPSGAVYRLKDRQP